MKVYPNNVTYNSLLDCCVRCFDMATATNIFEEMTGGGCKKSKEVDDSKIRPDLISYSTMIKGFCKEKNIEQAFYMLEVMDKQGIKADEVLYNSLLDGCCKANEVDMALKVYSNMRALGIRPSNVTFSILVKVHSKRQDLTKALAVLQEMKKEGLEPGLIVYTCLIQSCIRVREMKKAWELFEEMRKCKEITPDAHIYSILSNGLLLNGHPDRALDLMIEAIELFGQDH